MRRYRADTTIPTIETPEPAFDIGVLCKATLTSSIALALAATGGSFLVWGSVWLELTVGAALLPVGALGLGMAAVVVRGLVLALGSRDQGDEGAEVDEPNEERVRLVPVNKRLIVHGVDSEDLAYFVRVALGSGDWTQNRWRASVMPSGRRCDNNYHRAIMEALVKVGIVQGYGRSSTGHATTDAEGALRLLGLSDTNTANRTNRTNSPALE